MTFEADVKKWVGGTKPYNWLNQCAGLTMSICRHFGYAPALGKGGAYATATAAYQAAKIESTNPAKAPIGAIHYWSYTATINSIRRNYGHVVVDIRGKGTHTLSATRNAAPMWGVNAGLISVARQTALIGGNGRYLGWSRYYGDRYFVSPPEAPAGGDSKPLEDVDVFEAINRPISRKARQVLRPEQKQRLYLNDENHVTVASGPCVVLGGTVGIVGTHVGGPFDKGGYPLVVKLEQIVERVDSKGTTVEGSARRVGTLDEGIVNAGSTEWKYAVSSVALKANERLRFNVITHHVESFTIASGSVDISIGK